LLAFLGVDYEVTAVDVPEDVPASAVDPADFAAGLAVEKAVAALPGRALSQTVVTADTIVVLDGEILGKPHDRADARSMLERLSGRTHDVLTAVAVLPPASTAPETVVVRTPVLMRELDDAVVDGWLADDEIMGCAGAYNIERHLASVGPEDCYQNVAGLPACHVYGMLARVPELAGRLRVPVAPCEAGRGVGCRLGRSLFELGG
jgi:septum formation protein